MYGWPVAWFPYISAPDPSVKRASGLLMPSIGTSSHLGVFAAQPYYLGHRRSVRCHLHAGADHEGRSAAQPGIPPPLQQRLPAVGYLRGLSWTTRCRARSPPRASSTTTIPGAGASTSTGHPPPTTCATSASVTAIISTPTCSPSQIYVEGFGEGAYSRLDTKFYQGLSTIDRRQRTAGGAAALPIQLFRPAGRLGRPPLARCRRVQRAAHRRDQYAARQPDGELGTAICRRAGRSVEDHAARRCRRLLRVGLQRAAEFRHA